MPKTDITVKLLDENGNAWAILGPVIKALVWHGYSELAEKYVEEATSGDYDNLLRVTMEYVNIE